MGKIDAHQHFWEYSQQDYGWIGPEMAILKKDHLPEDLAPLLDSEGIRGTVAVQARQTVRETEWLLELADLHPLVWGVVGWVDLCGPELLAQLERFAGHPRFRGVRHVVQDEPDDEFMLRPDFVRGLGALRAFDLTYDILVFPRHLSVACQVVSQFPDQPFVLDHIAKPAIKDRQIEPWASDVRNLAAYPNICCKVSGMVTEADWDHWQPADMKPYLEVVFEAFGPRRIMFGSDWPVCTIAGAYAKVFSIVQDYVHTLSADEQAAVWGQTAQRFYGLRVPG
ncbi:MAG: amidohydrolase family protein [Anaerolineae bacterium]|nr:amidohydrolase family protein [Anaerolineae bacterium]